MLALYDRVLNAHRHSRYADDEDALDFVDEVVAEACRRAEVIPCESLLDALKELVWQLLCDDFAFFFMPDRAALANLSIERGIALRAILSTKECVLANPSRYEDIWREKVIRLTEGFLGELPPAAFDDSHSESSAAFSILLIDLCSGPGRLIERLMATMYDDDIIEAGLFNTVREQFEHNFAAAMGMTREHAQRSGKQAPLPTGMTMTPPRDIVTLFLGGTPYALLFYTELPFAIPEAARFEHTHIVAGSGHGKTQTLQHLILSDLKSPDPPAMVIIDSQGDMIGKIARLALFDEELADRLVIIDPRDVDHPPALNMFDVNLERISRYGAADREQILNGVVELYEYFFGSLLGAELTQKQSLVFRYLARLMIQIPSANLRTMIDLMDDIGPYQHVIERLPESSRMFFEKEFGGRQFNETRTQVKRRLYGIIENQTFERMFSAPRNRIDLSTAINEGKIILVNTAKDFLKSNSSILGRYFIALTLQAALERAAIPEDRRRPAFLYIDEASEYFDTNVDDLLIQARKYKLGIIVAHQYLDQLQGGLRSSFAANTSIKLTGGVSDRDAHAIAPDMRTTPRFILEQRRATKETHFACYLRNVTPTAVSLSVPLGVLENEPQMSPEAYDALIARNRAHVSGDSGKLTSDGPAEGADPHSTGDGGDPNTARDKDARSEKVTAPQGRGNIGSGQEARKGKPASGQNTDASPEW
jgi:hypothetical protein